jgi:hypothetical protein
MFDPRVRYALAVLLDGTDLDRFQWPSWVTYGAQRPDCAHPGVQIIPSAFFGKGYGTADSLPTLPLAEIEGVPLLFGSPLVEKQGSLLIVHADIIASAYFLLTRYEECIRRDVRDEHGRFPGRESIPFRAGFIGRPIVDEYAVLLRRWVSSVGIELPEPKRHFSVLLTHDVDSLGPEIGFLQAVRYLASGLLGRRSLRQAVVDSTIAVRLRRNPCDNLDTVIQLDHRVSDRGSSDRCRSVYFFMAGGTSPYDGAYSLGSARTGDRLRQVSASGADIGLHASYEAGGDPTRIGVERRLLEQVTGTHIQSNRHHYLRWRESEDGAATANAGISWDATLGYADLAGFRLGVCRPVPLFDPIRRQLLGIEEHPLIVMDGTLDGSNYMDLAEEAAFDCVRSLADANDQEASRSKRCVSLHCCSHRRRPASVHRDGGVTIDHLRHKKLKAIDS